MQRKVLKIGSVTFENPFFLAPMAGFSDLPFRRVVAAFGTAMGYSEMVSAKGLYYGDGNTERILAIHRDEGPVAFQIFGSDPDIMAFAAEMLNDRKNVILDVNMGCPVPKIVKNGEGSALLKDPELIYKIIKKMLEATDKTVTVKVRTGFGRGGNEGLEAALAAEEAGASAVAVHGRTREEYYEGTADRSSIKKISDALNVPVIGSGDVFDAESGLSLITDYGCDFVMAARGAVGNPWIFPQLNAAWKIYADAKSSGKILTALECANQAELEAAELEASKRIANPFDPSREEKKEVMLKHFEYMIEEKGEYSAVREMRKFAGKYMKGEKGSSAFRGEINTINNASELKEKILRF